jgi:group II intron reverse transcriptase/maturase
MKKRVNWVLDADIRGFFDTISHEWLAKFIEHRIADRRVISLIQKWLKAGVLEDGKRTQSEEGTPQGGSISPLLANIYLHYVFDLWAQQWRKKRARGDVIFVRYADDSIAGFEHKSDAERFLAEFKERLQKFGLELNPKKTRLIEFGRYAAERRKARGEGKPETFDFLGFTHICGETRKGKFTVKRKTIHKRLWAKLKEVKTDLKRRLHETVQEVGQWLKSVVVGHTRYYGVPGNYRALETFCFHTGRLWRRALRRRSQKSRLTWERMQRIIKHWLPPVRILHPYPDMRLGVIT